MKICIKNCTLISMDEKKKRTRKKYRHINRR